MIEIEILWTGGYDSSFRIAQLSKIKCAIQPYYLKDQRKSEEYELGAIQEISDIIRRKVDTKCELLPLITMNTSEVQKNESVTLAFQEILKKQYFGSQYDWLARFAVSHPGLELNIHKKDKASIVIQKYGKVKKKTENEISYFVLDQNRSENALRLVFGSFHLPLFHLTKVEMKKIYRQMELVDIAERAWFCFTPINGEPCGICNPCRYTIEEGLSERLSKEALSRYRKNKFQLLRQRMKSKISVGLKLQSKK